MFNFLVGKSSKDAKSAKGNNDAALSSSTPPTVIFTKATISHLPKTPPLKPTSKPTNLRHNYSATHLPTPVTSPLKPTTLNVKPPPQTASPVSLLPNVKVPPAGPTLIAAFSPVANVTASSSGFNASSNTLFIKSTLNRYPPISEDSSNPFNQRHSIIPATFNLLQLHVILQIVHGLPDCPSHPHRYYRPTFPNRPDLQRAFPNGNRIPVSTQSIVRPPPVAPSWNGNISNSHPVGLKRRKCRPGGMNMQLWEQDEEERIEKDTAFYQILRPEEGKYFSYYAPGCYISHSHPHDLPVSQALQARQDPYQYKYFRHLRDERLFKIEDILTRRHTVLIYEYDDVQLDVRYEIMIELKDIVVYKEVFGQLPQCMTGTGDGVFSDLGDDVGTGALKPDTDTIDVTKINTKLFKTHNHVLLESPQINSHSVPVHAPSPNFTERSRKASGPFAASRLSLYSHTSWEHDENETDAVAEEKMKEKPLTQDYSAGPLQHTLTLFSNFINAPAQNTIYETQTASLSRQNLSPFETLIRSQTPTLNRQPSSNFNSLGRRNSVISIKAEPIPPSIAISAHPMKCYMCRRYHSECKNGINQPCMSVVRGTRRSSKRISGLPSGFSPDGNFETCCYFCVFADRTPQNITFIQPQTPINSFMSSRSSATFVNHNSSSPAVANLTVQGNQNGMTLKSKRSSLQFMFRDDNSEDSTTGTSYMTTGTSSSNQHGGMKISNPYSMSPTIPSTPADSRDSSLDSLYHDKKILIEDERRQFLETGECIETDGITGLAPCKLCMRLQRRMLQLDDEDTESEGDNVESDSESAVDGSPVLVVPQDFHEQESGRQQQPAAAGGLFAAFTGKWTPEPQVVVPISEPQTTVTNLQRLRVTERENAAVHRKNKEKLKHPLVVEKRISRFWDMGDN